MEFYIGTYETAFMIRSQQLLALAAPKKRTVQSDDLDSENYVLQKNHSQSVPRTFNLLGFFSSINEAEEGLYQLIGRLIIQPGIKTVKVMSMGEVMYTLDCIAVDGLKVTKVEGANVIVFEVEIKLTEAV